MKIECSRKELSDALGLTTAASSVRTALMILQTLKIEAEGSNLTLLGCDGEMWAERRILANVQEPGAICVQAKLLQDIVASLPDGTVALELQDTSLFLRQGSAEWRMMALPAEEFPKLPEVEGTSRITLSMGELRDAVSGVSYAVADDNSRPVLTGVLFRYDGKKLTLVATDTHRLAVLALDRDGIGSDISAIVPEKALRTIRNLPMADTEEVTIRFDETRLGVDAGDCKVVSQLLVGTYPNWERVVPQEHTRTWVVDRTELMDNVKRAMIMARDNANRVRFTGRADQILISARSEDKGEAKEEIQAVCKNGEIDIAFNGKYVQDALAAIRTEGVLAEMTEPSRPALFRPVDGGDQRYCVIMPMALG